ncbi:MAG: bifunctional diaminohydroxyphosphoribosylaminopyrimidine deaminase/5-amino-6-(5-phosphoribosylamino)uracil reductase RibD [Puniceicoccales bacterium]|jgi:diaminohydroxyphosphoribosylaminopyrimidine deaminase/5-amino-6-(5-phosphoribosylamino)uracil reductase|nr:bifunctional diaminohydroxyphosphoribosylaminopyrimidine deaminase/5-amino-6-(5-phosphoribosylamino)uracil reductase RibD [Puniceicoccales bacterium]
MDDYQNWMRQALQEARRAWGETHPNPLVGALIVEAGDIVARGWHARSGEAHAEINALRSLGRLPKPGATLVVTLEPCSTHGRTGACTNAILNAGISRVLAGAADPFPAHAGRGFTLLRSAGVEVITGVLEEECTDLNLIFNHWAVTGQPLVALKTASTLDGRIATRTGQSQWITGAAARADVMLWRRYFPAIATSAATVLADNPRLTSRTADAPEWCPVRFIFDRRLRTADRGGLNVFEDAFAARTIIVTADTAPAGQVAALERRGITVWRLDVRDDATLFGAFKQKCAAAGLTGVLVEGGGTFSGAWLKARAADYLFHYTAPKVLADTEALPAFAGAPCPALEKAFTLQHIRHAVLGDDILTRGHLT